MEIKQGLPSFGFTAVEQEDKELVSELTQEEKEELVRQYDEEIKAEWARKKESGIPIRFQDASFSNYKTTTEQERKNLEVCKNFVEGKARQMLLFIGKYGNGKTHLGCAIIREARTGKFTTSFEICTRYEMGSDYKATENRWEVLERYINYDVLVVDEFGRAKPEIEKLIIPYIINARYENRKKTVIITNISKDNVINILGEATIDRLKEVCSTIVFSEDSKRGKTNE